MYQKEKWSQTALCIITHCFEVADGKGNTEAIDKDSKNAKILSKEPVMAHIKKLVVRRLTAVIRASNMYGTKKY